tara:strand:- start:9975 stop:10817 length:843 start_codon:yes stop_codon:yes gene_type:complete
MLWRFRDLFDGGQDLLRAEAQLAVRKVRRSLMAALVLALAAGVALIGFLVLLAGVGVALAREWGWVWSLTAIGAGLLVLGLIAAGVISGRLRAIGESDTGPGPKEKARQSKEQMSDAVDPTVSKEEAHPESKSRGPNRGPKGEADNPLEELKAAAIEFATRNPMAVAGGAFAVASLIGPGRAVRMVSRGLTVASIAASVLGKLGEDEDEPERTAAASPRPGPSAAQRAGGNGRHAARGTPPTPDRTSARPGATPAETKNPGRVAVPTRDAPPDRFRVTGQ